MNLSIQDINLSELDLLRESVDLECKLAGGRDGQGALPKDFWPTYSAMANTDGGWILLGIREHRGKFTFEGISNTGHIRKQLADILADRHKVSANLLTDQSIREYQQDGKNVLAIKVPRANRKDKPVFLNGNPYGGNCYRRFHETDQKMADEDVRFLLAEQAQDSLDSRILPKFGVEDISMKTLQVYRKTHATLNPGHVWTELDNMGFLQSVRAWNRDRETGEEGLTVAGLLMFGRFQSIQDEFPNYMLDYQERPEAKTEKRWIDRVSLDGTWSGNLFDFYRIVYPKLIAGLKIPFEIKGGLRNEDTPVHIALREALANTLIHADYRQRSRLLVVKRPDMFGFQNPGEMRIPPERALKGDEPDCRNRVIAQMFRFVNIGEQAGTGIPKILSGWNSQHWRLPSLSEERDPSPRTLMRLQMLDLFPPGVLDFLRQYFQEQFKSLSETERIALAVSLGEHRLTHQRLLELTQEHPSDITKTLRKLVDEGFLESEGTGRGMVYRLAGTVVVTPEDVFDSSDSLTPSSDSLTPSSDSLVSLGSDSLNLSSDSLTPRFDNSDGRRDTKGRLLSDHHTLPFIDDLKELDPDFLQRLHSLAIEPRTKRKLEKGVIKSVILELCSDQFITLACLEEIVNRKKVTLRTQYLTQMCNDQEIRMAFPDKPNDSRQAYTKA